MLQQVDGELDERLAHLFDVLAEPTLLVGMDTPQLRATDVGAALRSFAPGTADDVDCWFGPAADGGFWALGMREPRGDLVRGVPMSRNDTGALQRRRLEDAALSVGTLPVLTDIDTVAEASVVAAAAPDTRFALEFRRLTAGRPA